MLSVKLHNSNSSPLSSENLSKLSHSSTLSASDAAKAGASIIIGAFQQQGLEEPSHKASEVAKDNQSDVLRTSGTSITSLSFMKTNESSSPQLVTLSIGSFNETIFVDDDVDVEAANVAADLERKKKALAEVEARAKAELVVEAVEKAAVTARERAIVASAPSPLGVFISILGLVSLNQKVEILADVSTKYVQTLDAMYDRTLANIQGVVSSNSSDLSSFKESTLKMIEA